MTVLGIKLPELERSLRYSLATLLNPAIALHNAYIDDFSSSTYMARRYPLTVRQNNNGESYDLSVQIVHHRNARRLVLRVRDLHQIRITVPYGTLTAEALAFAKRQQAWIATQVAKLRQTVPSDKCADSAILYRGLRVRLSVRQTANGNVLCFADQTITIRGPSTDLQADIERHLRQLATMELPQVTQQLARRNKITFGKVTVRNQRTRWGSCSSKHDISLNWRLIQLPPFVRDYIILHELTHCLEFNHSPRFWALLKNSYPQTEMARAWLRKHHVGQLA